MSLDELKQRVDWLERRVGLLERRTEPKRPKEPPPTWKRRRCEDCGAEPGEPCVTMDETPLARPHHVRTQGG